MVNDLFAKFSENQEEENTYHAFRAATQSVAFFCIWGQDNRRLYYSYQSLIFFALSDKNEKLLLQVGNDYILIKGKELQRIANALQSRTLNYLRELPQKKSLSEIEAKTVITQTTIIKEFDPHLLLDS